MKRYFESEPVKGRFFTVGFIRYDKNVVDKSHFNPHQDNLADFMRSEIAKSSSGTPLYDTQSGKVVNVPTEIEIALRNNQLSRAEVSQLARESDVAIQIAKEKGEKVQAYLDSKTGFDPAQVNVESNKQ